MPMLLMEICDVFSGYAFKSFNDDKNGMPVIKIGNINSNGSIDVENCQYTIENPNAKFLSKKGDIYIALSGATTGKIGLMQEEGYLINQRVGIVRRHNGQIPVDYLLYFLKSKTNKILHDAVGSAQPNISPKDISKYEFAVKSDEEMSRISNELNLIVNLIKQLQTKLSNYDEIIKSRFIEMFGDPHFNTKGLPIVKPADISISLSAGGDKPKEVSEVKTEEFKFPIYANGEKDDGLYGWSKTYKIEKPAITISGRGTIGYSSFRRDGKFTPIVRLITLIPNQKVNPVYLTYYLNLEREEGSGSGVQQLTVPTFKLKDIILPDINDQNNFAEFAELIDKSKFNKLPCLFFLNSILVFQNSCLPYF